MTRAYFQAPGFTLLGEPETLYSIAIWVKTALGAGTIVHLSQRYFTLRGISTQQACMLCRL